MLVWINSAGPVDAAVDVRFGGEVHHRVELFLGKEPVHQGGIADIPFHEPIT